MNKHIFYIVSLLGTLLMTVASCEKEDVVIPTPESNCTSCPCMEFDGRGISESISSTTYSPAFYLQGGVTMQGKYNNYSGLGLNLGSVETILSSTLPIPNANLSGDILNIKDADVLFDYSNANHPTILKSISLKLGDWLSTANLKINGGSPQGYVVSESLSGEVELLGNINSIELGGENVLIDDVCLNDDISLNHIRLDSSLIEFADTVVNFINVSVTSANTNYSPTHQEEIRLLAKQHLPYPANLDYIDFRIKYAYYGGNNLGGGYMHWGTHNYIGIDLNSNFYGGLLELHNCDLEADFSSFSTVDKHISFDISNNWAITNPNEFEVNGAPLSTVPSGVSYSIIPLGNAANGSPCYRVVIEGPINTIVFKGNKTYYDNIYVHAL